MNVEAGHAGSAPDPNHQQEVEAMRNLNLILLAAICVAGFSGAVQASHDQGPTTRDMRRVRSLAIELDRQSDDWLEALNRRHRFPPPHSNAVLGDVVRFRREAREFRNSVERNMRRPDRTVDAFEKLYDAHQRLVGRWTPAHLGLRSDQYARRIDSLMGELGRYYPYGGYSRVDWNRLRTVSREIDRLADEVYSEARDDLRSSRRHDDWWIRDTLRRLEDLKSAARQFRRQADTSRPDYLRVRLEYNRLTDTYRYASTRVTALSPRTRRDFQRIGHLLNEIDRAFDPYRGPRWVSDVPLGFPTGPDHRDSRRGGTWGSSPR
jgi:hypothetical protein